MKGISVSNTLINNVFVFTILTRQPRFYIALFTNAFTQWILIGA